MNVKDGRCKETESWPRIVCSGVKVRKIQLESVKTSLDNSDPTSAGT